MIKSPFLSFAVAVLALVAAACTCPAAGLIESAAALIGGEGASDEDFVDQTSSVAEREAVPLATEVGPDAPEAEEPVVGQATKTPEPADIAPDFTLETFDGDTITLSDLRGRVVVVNFWASWCPPCAGELPDFQRVWTQYEGFDVLFIGIAVDDLDSESTAMLDDLNVTYPNGPDRGEEISNEYAAWALPTTVIVGPEGEIVHTQVGSMTYDQLADLLSELVTSD